MENPALLFMNPFPAAPAPAALASDGDSAAKPHSAGDSSFPWVPTVGISHRAKILELVKNLHSPELRIYSDAAKEFVSLLSGSSGVDFLREFLKLSPKCRELTEAWRLHKGKPGMSYILSLFSSLFTHAEGKTGAVMAVKEDVEGAARMIVEERMDDIYVELGSGEPRRETAALNLMASIVSRGHGLASEVARRFNFKLPALFKLSGLNKRGGRKGAKSGSLEKSLQKGAKSLRSDKSVRKAFIAFAMAFLEVGNRRLLRWVLQQRELYSGVLQGIGTDSNETIVYILVTLRDKVLIEGSLIPAGLRSVLFGSVTLEQLSCISGNLDRGAAADVAHDVLVMVCTDPKNGLMPGVGFKGNERRLSDLLKKLNATYSENHKKLLLSVFSSRPSLCATYMDDFPYQVDPCPSLPWFAAISLAADVISSMDCNRLLVTLLPLTDKSVVGYNDELMKILRCIVVPRVFSRAVLNRGLLHSNDLVQHGAMRLVLESVKLLSALVGAINDKILIMSKEESAKSIGEDFGKTLDFSESDCSVRKNELDGGELNNLKHEVTHQGWLSVKDCIQDFARGALPDSQVLLKLLSFARTKSKRPSIASHKSSESAEPVKKKPRIEVANEDVDIVICGIDVMTASDKDEHRNRAEDAYGDSDRIDDQAATLSGIWNIDKGSFVTNEAKAADLFRSKLLDVLKYYMRTIPFSFDGSVDISKILQSNPQCLTEDEQRSSVSLLVEFAGQTGDQRTDRIPESIYKHLQPLLNLLLNSKAKDIHDQAYILVRAALVSSGAFDHNFSEIDAWLAFLPGYRTKGSDAIISEAQYPFAFSPAVISFLCDAVCTVGNNLFKYQDLMDKTVSQLQLFDDDYSGFGPLILCMLQKCLKLLESDPGSLKTPARPVISLYVCNTISLILQSQPGTKSLANIIIKLLSERTSSYSSVDMESESWRPVMNLLKFCHHISQQNGYSLLNALENMPQQYECSSGEVLSKVMDIIGMGCPSLKMILTEYMRNSVGDLENILIDESDRMKSADMSVGNFLINAPYYSLYPALVLLLYYGKHATEVDQLSPNKVLDSLKGELAEHSAGDLLLSLRTTFFWSYQLLLSYLQSPSDHIAQISQVSFSLIDYMFELISVQIADLCASRAVTTSSHLDGIQGILNLSFDHPLIGLSLSSSFSDGTDLATLQFDALKDAFLSSSKEALHLIDRCVLQYLSKLFDFLRSLRRCKADHVKDYDAIINTVFQSSQMLLQKILLFFKENFKLWNSKRKYAPLLRCFCYLRTGLHLMSPFKLLELAEWMFTEADEAISERSPSSASAAFICLFVADAALEMYCSSTQVQKNQLFWDSKIENFDASIIKKVYLSMLHVAACINQEFVDRFLLKAVDRFHHQSFTRASAGLVSGSKDNLQCYMLFPFILSSTPTNTFNYFFCPISKVKANILQLLIEMSPAYMDMFSQYLFGIQQELPALNSSSECPSDGDLVILLPAVLSYVTYHMTSGNQNPAHLEPILMVYSRVLLRSLYDWKHFVDSSIFGNTLGENVPESCGDFASFFDGTLLGSSLRMFHTLFSMNMITLSKMQRLKVFSLICGDSKDLLDANIEDIRTSESLTAVVSQVITKISLLRLVLSPPCLSSSDVASEKESRGVNKAKLSFVTMLLRLLEKIVKHFPQRRKPSCYTADYFGVNTFLEAHIWKTVVLLSLEIQKFLIQLDSLPFFDPFVRSSLLHRFDDPSTLNAIRCIIVVLSEGKISAAKFIELLLGHSHFLSAITDGQIAQFSSASGTILQPLPSILKFINASFAEGNDSQRCNLGNRKIELIRLLRVLYNIKSRQQDNSLFNESRELVYLLLSVYGGTISDIDMELLHLMNEIEAYNGAEYGLIMDVDYVWGRGALKLREELKSAQMDMDHEAVASRRKALFREVFPVDSKLCAMTALQYCYDRSSRASLFSVEKLFKDDFKSWNQYDGQQEASKDHEVSQRYDPVYLLRFSINVLLREYMDPVEFAKTGLLAITFIGISSPDEETRRLSYESLGNYKKLLESSQPSKDRLQLQLLLTYVQNGISESWQKIPSVSAIFAAEASLVLLDPSHSQFLPINKFLLRSSNVNLKDIPLFESLFESSSIAFRSDQIWILQLLFAGVNLNDDAKIYRKKNVFNHLLRYFSSSVSDPELKFLTLQIISKSVKLRALAHHLTKESGLLPWLSSTLSLIDIETPELDRASPLVHFELILRIILDLTLDREITDWIQETALEQLSELSCSLYNFFMRNAVFLETHDELLNLVLGTIVSTLRLSRQTKKQTLFRFSLDGLYHVCQAVNLREIKNEVTTKLAIDVITMSPPVSVASCKDKLKLTKIVSWAMAVLSKFSSSQRCHSNNLKPDLLLPSKEQHEWNNHFSRLLRWVTASIILGSFSVFEIMKEGPCLETLQPLVEEIRKRRTIEDDCSVNVNLVAAILYLNKFASRNSNSMSSVILALCLLIFEASNNEVREHLWNQIDEVESLCSKIRSPPETNPSWRWSYDQPWSELAVQTETNAGMAEVEEEQSCRRLLVILSDAFGMAMHVFRCTSRNVVS